MPDKGPPAGSPPNLAEVERTSAEFARLASIVTEQLNDFDEWVNSLPAKVEVRVGTDGTSAEAATALLLCRIGERWGLKFAEMDLDDTFRFESLNSLSLIDKCRVVQLIPSLLREFYRKQRDTVARMNTAAAVLAELPNAKGGK